MASNVYNLREFFRSGRKATGAFMGENECLENAVERNLSCMTDGEIVALRDAATGFAAACDAVLLERVVDDPDPFTQDRGERLNSLGYGY